MQARAIQLWVRYIHVAYSQHELRNLGQRRFAALLKKVMYKHDVHSECPFNVDFINFTLKGALLWSGFQLSVSFILQPNDESLINDFKEWKQDCKRGCSAEHVMLDSLGFIKIWHVIVEQSTYSHTSYHLLPSATCYSFPFLPLRIITFPL